MTVERRIKETRIMEIQALQDVQDRMIVEGYAIVFNTPAEFKIGDIIYREVVVPSAVDGADIKDVAFKYNHSDDIMIMARTRNKTLQLIKDDYGVKVIAELANTTAARDLYELIRRGDIDKMSFSFTVREDKYDKDTRTRTILAFDRIFDVSAVDFPAYDATTIAARSFESLESELKALESVERRRRLLLITKTI